MSVKKEYQSVVNGVLKDFGTVKKVGGATRDGSVDGLQVATRKELLGGDLRRLAELTTKVPCEVAIKRSGAGLRILVN